MFIKLTMGNDNKPVYININSISRYYIVGNRTWVCFDTDHFVSVIESPEEIYNRIQKYRGEL